MEPFIYGDYPGSMKRLVEDRLLKFTEDEKKLVKGSFDFIGINYYTSTYTKDTSKGAARSPPSYTSDSLANETGGGIREF
jgi:beta-glucosidase